MRNILFIALLFADSISVFGQKIHSKNTTGELLYSFAVLGCNRVDKKDVNDANPSTANIKVLEQIYDDIAGLQVVPDLLFFTGDLVMGYCDTITLEKELNAWKNIFEKSKLSSTKIKLIAMPGNHESMPGKTLGATESAERTWIRAMKKYILGNNGPHAYETDSMLTDQSELSYSFDFKESHFIVLNSDPVGHQWQVPVKWVTHDLMKSASTSQYTFAFAHKPAYPFAGEDGLDRFPVQRDSFWSALERTNAVAFLSAHNHVYYRTQPHEGKTWQVIAGNGGSLLSDKIMDEKLKYFGFVLVKVYSNGEITSESYGRLISQEGYLKANPAPLQLMDSFILKNK